MSALRSAVAVVSLVICGGMTAVLAQVPLATIPTGEIPTAIGVNVATNTIYAVGGFGRTLVAINGTTFRSTTIPLQDPGTDVATAQVAVNPITNTIFVTNVLQDHVAVIDGRTHAVSFVPTGHHPSAMALNVVTNTLYVANVDSATVTAVDGATLMTTHLPVGASPSAVAVNAATNTVYVANHSGSVSVIDGVTNRVSNLAVGAYPVALAVDVAANRVYVVSLQDHTLSEIDGVTNVVLRTVPLNGAYPSVVAVNSVTRRVYVGFQISGHVVAFDVESGVQSVVTTGMYHGAFGVDTLRDRVYTPGTFQHVLGTIKGRTLTSTTVPALGAYPWRVEVNPSRNLIYVANMNSRTVTIYLGEPGTPLQDYLDARPPRSCDEGSLDPKSHCYEGLPRLRTGAAPQVPGAFPGHSTAPRPVSAR